MKLSIADLVDNCSAEELMIEKEERELTARVKARRKASRYTACGARLVSYTPDLKKRRGKSRTTQV